MCLLQNRAARSVQELTERYKRSELGIVIVHFYQFEQIVLIMEEVLKRAIVLYLRV